MRQQDKMSGMQNITLNPGGIIGAVVLLAAVIVVVILASPPDTIGGRIGGFGAGAVFFGAAGGNYLWDRCFPKH